MADAPRPPGADHESPGPPPGSESVVGARGQSRIFIGPDGEVVVENLTPELLEVALALDPTDARLRAIAAAAQAGGEAPPGKPEPT